MFLDWKSRSSCSSCASGERLGGGGGGGAEEEEEEEDELLLDEDEEDEDAGCGGTRSESGPRGSIEGGGLRGGGGESVQWSPMRAFFLRTGFSRTQEREMHAGRRGVGVRAEEH